MKKLKHPNYGLVYTFCGLHIFYRLKRLIERKKKRIKQHMTLLPNAVMNIFFYFSRCRIGKLERVLVIRKKWHSIIKFI